MILRFLFRISHLYFIMVLSTKTTCTCKIPQTYLIILLDVTGNPLFCVAARIKQNGVVEKSIRECRDHLPALCVEVLKTSTDAPSKTFSTLSDLPDKDGVSGNCELTILCDVCFFYCNTINMCLLI